MWGLSESGFSGLKDFQVGLTQLNAQSLRSDPL